MRNISDCFKLINGYAIPCLGFGTWQTPDGDAAKEAVYARLKVLEAGAGYGTVRLQRTGRSSATVYGNPASLPIREDFPTSTTNRARPS